MSERRQRRNWYTMLRDDPLMRRPRPWASPLDPEPVIVQGFDLTGTMVYLSEPGAHVTPRTEPSTIDPALPLSARVTSPTPAYYARTYHDLAPDQRHAYLAWLAGGRRAPGVDRAFLRLYLYGLERRVLLDSASDLLAQEELPAIGRELVALEKAYRGQQVVSSIEKLLQVITILLISPDQEIPLPPIDASTWEEPPLLRFGLGTFVANKRPIPPAWAAVWAWYRRDTVIRSALYRATEEFQVVFADHYTRAYGEGLTFKPGKRDVSFLVHASNFTLGPTNLSLTGIPDIFSRPSAGQKLRPLIEQTWVDLGPYARAVSRSFRPDESLSMAALLPPILQTRAFPSIHESLRTLDTLLGDRPAATLSHADLVDLWWPRSWDGSPATRQLAAKDRKAFAALIGRFGYGIEPDPRYGKRAGQRATDDVTIFRADGAIPEEPGPAWNAAVVAAQLAAVILAQEGALDETTAAHLAGEVGAAFAPHPTEATRLAVWLRQLAASEEPVKIAGLKGFIDPLTEGERERIADLAIGIAGRQGTVAPAVVTLVQRIARTLGLDPASVPSRLFGAMTRDASTPAAPATARRASRARSGAFALDHTAIAATEAATAAVSDLLGGLLAEEDRPAAPAGATVRAGAAETIAGLDAAHSAMLRALAASGDATWPIATLEQLAQAHHLLGAGAIDTLNDAALDHADEPLLVDEGEAFTLDREVLALLLATAGTAP